MKLVTPFTLAVPLSSTFKERKKVFLCGGKPNSRHLLDICH
jgi:hypothetical protein